MQYLGGKQRIAKDLCEFLQQEIDKSGYSVFWEPFLGGNNIAHRIKANRIICSDANEALITYWEALQNGWRPNIESVTEDLYRIYRANPDPKDPMTAFLGFGCSFGGMWFGGFARSGDRDYAKNALNSSLKKIRSRVTFIHAAYDEPEAVSPTVIYCDPPYEGTTGYKAVGAFDHAKFWEWCREMTRRLHRVYVSEYVAPDDFKEVWSIETKTDLHGKGRSGRTERLFTFEV